MSATLTPAQSAVPIIRIASLPDFIREHAQAVRHREVRWATQPVTQIADQQVLFDSAATEAVILDGMMRLAQRLSCGHPDSHWIAVIAALRHMKEAAGA